LTRHRTKCRSYIGDGLDLRTFAAESAETNLVTDNWPMITDN
jgi:hypothetical protein